MNPGHASRILTATVGSCPVPDWLAALPSGPALVLTAHHELGERHRDDRVALDSVHTAPLGAKLLFDPSPFERQPMP